MSSDELKELPLPATDAGGEGFASGGEDSWDDEGPPELVPAAASNATAAESDASESSPATTAAPAPLPAEIPGSTSAIVDGCDDAESESDFDDDGPPPLLGAGKDD